MLKNYMTIMWYS